MSHDGSIKMKTEVYGALVIALSCLCTAIITWGDNWILSCILVLGILICGSIGIFDIIRMIRNKH
ncbi:hypothetical protein N780_01965 [Pontibacillus chungwhensis BH030062]|uniref:Uncharacterized protein n=1 Tax=Pontibacillus chungwhensis BH030062 TaxID=1385513 RepID=A0A0A2UWN1_9BACI|nr:hypothetical protein N780_01965 [Pontibacillus chungwhensis BH030062]